MTLSVSTDGITGALDACPIPADSQSYNSVDKAIECAANGDTIIIASGTYTVGGVTAPLITIDKTLTIMAGDGQSVTWVPSTGTGSSGDARAWIVVNAGVNLDVHDIIFDGNGHPVFQAFRHRGSGTFTRVAFNNIQFQPNGPSYAGTAIAAFGGNVHVIDSSFSNIGRAGVLYFGAGITNALFQNNTYTGKGDGDHLDYALDISAGANVTASGNTVSGNRGLASVDGSTSAAILVTTFFGRGTTATINNGNNLNNNTSGVVIGDGPGDASTVIVDDNIITHNSANGIGVSSAASVTISSNDISNNDDGIDLAHVGSASVQGNNISNNQTGIELVGTAAIINNTNIINMNRVGIDVSDDASTGSVINHNQFCDNTEYAAQNRGTIAVDATLNWWGAFNGPVGGDAVSNGVLFSPFSVISPAGGLCAQIQGSTSTGLDEPALCNLVDGDVNEIVRADITDRTVTDGVVLCRVIAENGTIVTHESEIGHITVVQRGVIQAIEFSGLRSNGESEPEFNNSLAVCLRGIGNLTFLSALRSPRLPQPLTASQMTIAGRTYTCGSVPDAGTVVLTER